MFTNIFALCLTSQRNSGWVMKYIYVHDCFDVCSWVQTHLVRVWECVRMRVRACLRQQFRAAQSMLGSLSLQIKQGEITQVHRGENPPSPTFSVCLPFSITPSISSFLSHAHLYQPTSTVLFQFYENVTLWWREMRNKERKILQSLLLSFPF